MPIAAFDPVDRLSERDLRIELKMSTVEFVLSRSFWEAFAPGIDLRWSRPLRFSKKNKSKIPSAKGVYAFSIKCSNSSLPTHRIVFYVGQAGGNPASRNTLKKRFSSYFFEKRKRLLRFFDDYEGHIDFQYCELDIDRKDILELEKQLNNVLQPPANDRDFSTKMKAAQKANLR